MESLVLLKHELCWTYEDVVVFGMHSRPENYDVKELTKEANDTIIFYNEGTRLMILSLLFRNLSLSYILGYC